MPDKGGAERRQHNKQDIVEEEQMTGQARNKQDLRFYFNEPEILTRSATTVTKLHNKLEL